MKPLLLTTIFQLRAFFCLMCLGWFERYVYFTACRLPARMHLTALMPKELWISCMKPHSSPVDSRWVKQNSHANKSSLFNQKSRSRQYILVITCKYKPCAARQPSRLGKQNLRDDDDGPWREMGQIRGSTGLFRRQFIRICCNWRGFRTRSSWAIRSNSGEWPMARLIDHSSNYLANWFFFSTKIWWLTDFMEGIARIVRVWCVLVVICGKW